MSVRERIEDAKILFESGRGQGALLSVMVAIAATARKRRPRKEAGDKRSFVSFLGEEMIVVTSGAVQNYNVQIKGKLTGLQDILYEFVRCELVHEGKLANEVKFVPPPGPGQISLSASSTGIELTENWMDGFAAAVQLAPENKDEFEDFQGAPDDVLKWMVFHQRRDSTNVTEYWKRREGFSRKWAARPK